MIYWLHAEMARMYTQDEVDQMMDAKDKVILAKDKVILAKDNALEAKDKTIHSMRYVWLLKNRCHVQARRTPW